MGAWFPSVTDSLTDGPSVLIGILSLTTGSSSEYWGPWIDGDSTPLTLPTIFSLDLQKRVDCSSSVKHSSPNSGSSHWSNMTWILVFFDVTSLIQTSRYAAMLLTTIENISSNKTWYCGEIEPVNRFRTNPTRVKCIFSNPILTPIWLPGSHLGIFTPGFWNFGSKIYILDNPKHESC